MIEFFETLVGLMQFTSVVYLVFLAMAVVVYFVLPGVRTRTAWLLVLSSLFYLLLSPRWFWVLIAVTAFTYGAGRMIGAARARRGELPPQLRDKLLASSSEPVLRRRLEGREMPDSHSLTKAACAAVSAAESG